MDELDFENGICKDQAWVSSPNGEWTQPQQAQNNEFVESGLKDWVKGIWTTNKMDSSDKNKKIDWFKPKKIVLDTV